MTNYRQENRGCVNTAQMCTKEGQRVPLLVRMNDDILAGAGDGMGWDDGQATTSDKALKINSLSPPRIINKVTSNFGFFVSSTLSC